MALCVERYLASVWCYAASGAAAKEKQAKELQEVRQHTRAQYRALHSTIRYLSTARRIAPYASSVPRIA
eukprot:2581933-Rhodomonas_salina.1